MADRIRMFRPPTPQFGQIEHFGEQRETPVGDHGTASDHLAAAEAGPVARPWLACFAVFDGPFEPIDVSAANVIDVKLAQKWTDVVLEIALVQMGARGLFVLPRVVFQIAGAEIIDSCALPPRLADGGEVFACPDLAPEDLRLCACGVGRPGRAVLAN